jgi:hypothetical protein
MATFATLKLSTAVKPAHMPAVQVRRKKLVRRLWEQMELAKAQQAGTQFAPTKFRSIADPATGMRKQVEVTKRVKQWWFTADNGKFAMNVRYGARVIELAKGKSSIEIGSTDQLLPTLELIKQAVEAGELDAQIEVAANKLREGFAK